LELRRGFLSFLKIMSGSPGGKRGRDRSGRSDSSMKRSKKDKTEQNILTNGFFTIDIIQIILATWS
jgi:hypothetical protein